MVTSARPPLPWPQPRAQPSLSCVFASELGARITSAHFNQRLCNRIFVFGNGFFLFSIFHRLAYFFQSYESA